MFVLIGLWWNNYVYITDSVSKCMVVSHWWYKFKIEGLKYSIRKKIILSFVAVDLAETLSADMRKEGLRGRTLTLKLKTSSFEVQIFWKTGDMLKAFSPFHCFLHYIILIKYSCYNGLNVFFPKSTPVYSCLLFSNPCFLFNERFLLWIYFSFLVAGTLQILLSRSGLELWLCQIIRVQVKIFWDMLQSCWRLNFLCHWDWWVSILATISIIFLSVATGMLNVFAVPCFLSMRYENGL